MICCVTDGCPSTVKVTLTIAGRSTSRCRALIATMPFVLRMIERQQGQRTERATEAKAEAEPGTTGPSYNPYARED